MDPLSLFGALAWHILVIFDGLQGSTARKTGSYEEIYVELR